MVINGNDDDDDGDGDDDDNDVMKSIPLLVA